MTESAETGALTRDQALEMLRGGEQGIFEWNRARADGRGVPSLAELDLRGSSLSAADLSGVDLTHAVLQGSDLFEANLDGADLSEADLSDAHLSDVSLSGATLIEAKLCRANLMGADLSQARLSYADLSEANLIGADMTKASLNRAKFTGAQLVGSHLALSKLSGTSFRRADMRGAELSEAEFSEADLSFADLRKADLSRALLDSTELAGARLDDTCLDASVLTNVTLGNDHDLLVANWEHLGLNGTSYTRENVERGSQNLPIGRRSLKFSFELESELNSEDLRALAELTKLDHRPRGTRLLVELRRTGQVLIVEGRGELPGAAMLATLLFVLPLSLKGERRSAEYATGAGEGAASKLRKVVARALSEELLECAKKLSRPSIRFRDSSELERFVEQLHAAGANFVADESEVTLVERSRAAERAFLEALGYSDFLALDVSDRDESSPPTIAALDHGA